MNAGSIYVLLEQISMSCEALMLPYPFSNFEECLGRKISHMQKASSFARLNLILQQLARRVSESRRLRQNFIVSLLV